MFLCSKVIFLYMKCSPKFLDHISTDHHQVALFCLILKRGDLRLPAASHERKGPVSRPPRSAVADQNHTGKTFGGGFGIERRLSSAVGRYKCSYRPSPPLLRLLPRPVPLLRRSERIAINFFLLKYVYSPAAKAMSSKPIV